MLFTRIFVPFIREKIHTTTFFLFLEMISL